MKKDHALNLFFNHPKKSAWEFLYPVKKWSPKNSFSKRKNLRESIESNFYKLVNLIAKDLPVCTIFQKTQPVKKLLSMLSQVFSLRKWVFWRSFFDWIEKSSWTFFGVGWKTCSVRDLSSFWAIISKSEVWILSDFHAQ